MIRCLDSNARSRHIPAQGARAPLSPRAPPSSHVLISSMSPGPMSPLANKSADIPSIREPSPSVTASWPSQLVCSPPTVSQGWRQNAKIECGRTADRSDQAPSMRLSQSMWYLSKYSEYSRYGRTQQNTAEYSRMFLPPFFLCDPPARPTSLDFQSSGMQRRREDKQPKAPRCQLYLGWLIDAIFLVGLLMAFQSRDRWLVRYGIVLITRTVRYGIVT